MAKRRLHYVLSTHWDREWYQTFQDYRYRLVRLLDRVLDAIGDGTIMGPFTTDGQAIVVEDYLEIRPERRAQVEQYARDGRLVIGPWYVLPDEFIVSGEALIRNLRHGRALVRSLGARPSAAGFVCDIFGHNSQLPQILRGFGIRGAFVWRGCNETERRLLLWKGADGTTLPTYRFGRRGYCSYAFSVRHAISSDGAPDDEEMERALEEFIREELAATDTDAALLFDGGDHQEWDPRAYRVLTHRMAESSASIKIVHSSLDAFLKDVLPQQDRIGTIVEGELREPGREAANVDSQWLIPGVLSSRIGIKQANAECQTLLCQWAEPISAAVTLALGASYPKGFLDVAWRWLLQNQAHDSICGCSIDAVHQDMKYRFAQAQQIARRLTVEGTRQLATAAANNPDQHSMHVSVFNPLPRPLDEVCQVNLPIPTDWTTFNEFFGFEPQPAFRLFDLSGREIIYQRLSQDANRTKTRLHDTRFPERYVTTDVAVALPLTVPALGYTSFTLREETAGTPTRHPSVPALATSERSISNGILELRVEPGGSLAIHDLRSGETYERLLTLEDCADIGDGWYHGLAVNDEIYASTAARSAVAIMQNGPLQATLRIRTELQVPERFLFDRMVRSHSLVDLTVDSLVTLRRDADRVEVMSTVHNVARDHRLRVLFPTGAAATTYWADSPLDVIERPIPLRRDNHLYRELQVETRPQQSWVAVTDSTRGLAIISVGLMECAVRDVPEHPIALTLLRATGRTVMTDGEPDGQVLGDWLCRYWIVPLTGRIDATELCLLGQQLAAGITVASVGHADLADHPVIAPLPGVGSLLRVDGDAVVSSLRMVAQRLELRFFNPLTITTTTSISFGNLSSHTITLAQRVDLESNPVADAEPVQCGRYLVTVLPKEIATWSFW